MDSVDHTAQFCSEVPAAAYEELGVKLWTGVSLISGPGITAWLSMAGVRNFTTQEPSDLEYDPQLQVIAEWRDLSLLFQDHADNAVIEVMLEDADRGERIGYSWPSLPLVRVAKVYSMAMNLVGKEGPVPEVMSAREALIFKNFDRKHGRLKEGLLQSVPVYKERNGYSPPYWEMLEIVRQVKSSIDGS